MKILYEDAARMAFTAPYSPARVTTAGNYNIAVLGGTGFIGAHLVRRLLSEGQRIGVMARNAVNLQGLGKVHKNISPSS